MKRVALIKEIKSCHQCPYRSGGKNLGSPMYCTYFEPPMQIVDSNGHLTVDVIHGDEHWAWIAAFCMLPEDEVFYF